MIKGLMHVCLFANDIEQTLDFYKKLGCEVLFDIKMTPDCSPWTYYLKVAPGQYIELQTLADAAPSPHPSPDRVYTHPDRSLWHFAFETDDLKAEYNKLKEAGISVWHDPEKSRQINDFAEVYTGEDNCRIFWVIDPDGNPIEIMEQVGETLQRKYDKLV